MSQETKREAGRCKKAFWGCIRCSCPAEAETSKVEEGDACADDDAEFFAGTLDDGLDDNPYHGSFIHNLIEEFGA